MTSRNTGDLPHVDCIVIDEDTLRYGGSNFKRERTCRNTDYYPMTFSCSACGYVVENDLYAEEFAYCPNCGATKVVEK